MPASPLALAAVNVSRNVCSARWTWLRQPQTTPSSLLAAKSELGVVCGCLSQVQRAEQTLRETLTAASARGDAGMAAVVWNNLGNLLAGQNETDEAPAAVAGWGRR